MAEWRRVLKPGGTMLAIDGDWFDPGLARVALRTTSDLMRAVKERHYPLRYKIRYASIRKGLPLYSLKPEKVSGYLQEAGFTDIQIRLMKDLCRSARDEGSLLDKLDYAHPIYSIRCVKQ
jgi:ubiquinone/menaquinone biosynthesis C-methylase UbiE